jgi:hypothetical protein
VPTQPGQGVAAVRALSRELGAPEMVVAGGYYVDPYEETPELQWPLNLRVYDRMRRTDGHTRALLRSIGLPMLSTTWTLAGSRCRQEVVKFVEAELGLVPDEEGRRKARDGGVSFDPFLRLALLHLVFGFMPFNKWAAAGAPDPGVDPGLGPIVQHLGGLSPRMPRSVEFIDVNPDGSLIGIRQWVSRSALRGAYDTSSTWPNASGFIAPAGYADLVPIPAANMAYFVNEQEGADWAGQSILRPAYKHWLIKDFLMRVDANAADRNGTGLPVVTYPTEHGPAGRSKALAIATAVRTGDEAGVALEEGYTLALLGVEGHVHDTLKSITYHDQASSRSMLAMFLDLGHDGGLGHGSLGETFVDYFLLSIRHVLRYIEEVVTEQIIRDLVRWNFGPAEPYPTLIADDPTSEATPTAQALMQLAEAGLLIGDPRARADIRRRYGLPPEDGEAVTIPFVLARGVTDPGLPPDPNLPVDPLLNPPTPVVPPPPRPRPSPPALPPAPTPPARPALPAGGTTVDRKGAQLSAGDQVGVAVAGGILPGVVTHVLSAQQVAVDVAGIVGLFTPGEVQRAAAAPAPGPVDPESLGGLITRAHALSERLAALAERQPYGDVAYADPGYQPDGVKRYPLDTAAHVRAAASYISQADNRRAYTSRQLALIEARIRAAAKRLGIDTSL